MEKFFFSRMENLGAEIVFVFLIILSIFFAQDSFSQNQNSWRQDLGNGSYCEHVTNADGSTTITYVRRCFSCHGTGNCSACYGRGGVYGPAYGGMWYPCSACLQSGVCRFCKGCGVNQYTVVNDNGLSVGWDQNGKMFVGAGDTNNDSSDSYTSSNSSGGTCSKCGGKGYQKTPYKYAAASASGWMPPYYHRGGSGCPYCSSVGSHYYYPCVECHGHGHK